MDSKVSEKDMREVFVKAYGKEYDSADRKQAPLPLEIAYLVAVNKLKREGKYSGGGEITDDSYFQSVNHFIYFCMNYPNNFLDAFGSLKTHLSNKFKNYYNKYGVYGVMIKFYAELDDENRRILTDYSLKNYKGTPISSDISETEYFNCVNHFVYFCFNFPDNFMDAFSSHLKVHLSSKWVTAYEKKGSIGAMIYFWSELDNQNRRKLADWVKKNYTETKLYEVGGALGDVAGMLPSPLPMSTIQPMAKGGQLEFFADGGEINQLNENDFIQKKSFTIGNTKIDLEKLNNPKYYRANFFDLKENEKIGSYGSSNLSDVINDLKSENFAKGGGVDKRILVVSDVNNGKVINDLFNEWFSVKNEKQYNSWVENVKKTKFGTYGTISITEILEKFDFDKSPVNDVVKNDFKKEINNALNSYSKGGGVKFSDGEGIKVGDVVEVKEPNYGRDRDYYVVADRVGYDKDGFLISDVNKREQGVFEEEQLKKLYADGGGVEIYDTDAFETKLIAEKNQKEIKEYFDERFLESEIISGIDDKGINGYKVRYKLKKFAKGGGVDESKNKLGSVKVIFENPIYNYETNVSPYATEESVRDYFVGKMFNVGSYPNEDFKKVIDVEFNKGQSEEEFISAFDSMKESLKDKNQQERIDDLIKYVSSNNWSRNELTVDSNIVKKYAEIYDLEPIRVSSIFNKYQKKYSLGGEMDNISLSKSNAIDKIDYEYYAKQHAGDYWNEMSNSEKSELMNDIKENWLNDSQYKNGGETEFSIYKHGKIDDKPFEVVGVNYKKGLVRVKNFSENGIKEMTISEWIPLTFELGTLASFVENGKEASGEVVMRDGKKAISLYKDDNYGGDSERIRFFNQIDLSTLKSITDRETFSLGGFLLGAGVGIAGTYLYNNSKVEKDDKGVKIEIKKPKKVFKYGGEIEDRVKDKLSKNFALPFEIVVYVPSTQDADTTISQEDFKHRIEEVETYLAKLFGGFSANPVDGGYNSDEKGLIKEDVFKVYSFASRDGFEPKMEELVIQIKKWCKVWGQEAIGLEFEGDLFYVEA